ncbi:carboxymuconolactone decarboxylase family protein [Halobacillus sp. Marseille-P3879]|uniref:carboxymuconolactone decarboxylase family protein n=1 Tax=Halobacillus sp. Marseille-P3879 TaxID=2045014 RepID=UPI000C7D808D|nr:carboxymuconolactone decarboxylase family protein [Halobacillus sp. Marseille-P3879]
MSNHNLYQKSYFNRLPELGDLAPEAFKAFVEFDQKAVAPGKLPAKLKEIIAIAVAHTTGCPYCIEVHVNNARKQEVTREELSESIFVAAALKAGSAAAHGVNALNAYESTTEDLYKKSYFNKIKEFADLSGEAFQSFMDFDKKAMKAGVLSAKEKELIAVAVAHTTGCPYCIDIHTNGAKEQGASKEEVAESIFVATALKAGSALAHSVNALNAYDTE